MMPISSRDALLIIDVQNDFLPGGALAVPDGDAVIPLINRLATLPFGAVVATQDWHPPGHVSFQTSEPAGPWPQHCVAGTEGAALATGIVSAPVALVLRKGRSKTVDSYSAFLDNDQVSATGLASWLREVGVERVFVTGLALDYCVSATAIDAKSAGFESVVIVDACRGIGPYDEALQKLEAAGVGVVESAALA
ncbi:nicotinamidase [Acetobacter sacchari]